MVDIVKKLLSFCQNRKNLLFYGAGLYAWNLYAVLSKHDIKVDACLVSSGIDVKMFMDEIPIYPINLFDADPDKRYAVILALQSRYHEEVSERLSDKLPSSDLLRISDEEMEEIAQWRRVLSRDEEMSRVPVLSNETQKAFDAKVRYIHEHFHHVLFRFIDMRFIGSSLSWIYYFWEPYEDQEEKVFRLFYPVVLFDEMELKGTNEYLTSKMQSDDMEVIYQGNIDFWRYFFQMDPDYFLVENESRKNWWGTQINKFAVSKDFSNSSVHYIRFDEEEKSRGERTLKDMGLNKPYVCFCVRDNRYRTEVMKFRTDTQDMSSKYRNAPVENYRKAMEHLEEHGLCAVRMGAMAEKRISWKNTVDYASDYRSEFMDLFAFSRCEFFVSPTSGIQALAQLFSKPMVSTDVAILTQRTDYNLFLGRERDLVIFKKYWWEKEQRYLTFREMLEREVCDDIHELCSIGTFTLYERDGIVPVSNTPEEIDDVVQEMVARLNGTVVYDELDKELQQKFFDLMDHYPMRNNFPWMWRVGAKFLRNNQWLLNE